MFRKGSSLAEDPYRSSTNNYSKSHNRFKRAIFNSAGYYDKKDCERPRSSKTKQPPNGHRQGKFDVEHKGTNKDLDNDIKQLKERLEDLLIELYNSPKTMGDHGIKARELSSELRNWKGSLDKEMEFSLLDRIVEEYEAEVAGQKPKRWFWK